MILDGTLISHQIAGIKEVSKACYEFQKQHPDILQMPTIQIQGKLWRHSTALEDNVTSFISSPTAPNIVTWPAVI